MGPSASLELRKDSSVSLPSVTMSLLLLLLLVSEQDLRGSDLENMSLSKRFLKKEERGRVSTARGKKGLRGVRPGVRPRDRLRPGRRQNRKRSFLGHTSLGCSLKQAKSGPWRLLSPAS